MAFQPVADTVRVDVKAKYLGASDIINSLYFQTLEAPWTSNQMDALLATVRSTWQDNICLRLHSSYYAGSYLATDLTSEFGMQSNLPMTAPGQTGGVGLSPMNCILAQLRCGGSGAPRSGRLFMSPQAESALDGNQWTSGTVAAWAASFADVMADIDAAGWIWGAVSRYEGVNSETGRPIPRDPAIFKAITAVTIRNSVAAQRDRRPGEGS